MAGTDHTRAQAEIDGPAIILVEPQLGQNIGMVARAMLNCALSDLRLVRPRDGWPNTQAVAAASGADIVIERARVFESTADAVADLQTVYAATARPRDMTTDVLTPREAAARLRGGARSGLRAGVLFGKESKGLTNDDVSLADAVLMVPLNPAFTSLNLAQAVLTLGYEWFIAEAGAVDAELAVPKETRPATKAELGGLFEHLEDELEAAGFFHVREKKPIMVRNIRNVLQRARFTEQEIRTFRGIVTALSRARRKDGESG